MPYGRLRPAVAGVHKNARVLCKHAGVLTVR
jgi:hypothetical protein